MSEQPKRKHWVNWALFGATVVVVFLVGIFTAQIMERRAEKVARFQIINELPEYEPRNEVWGENFPRQWETYRQTLDTNFTSAHGGSSRIDYLEQFPELVIMWAGYAFSKEYNQGQGHAGAINTIRNILRTGGVEDSVMPATCWTCKSTDVPRVMAEIGVKEYYDKKWIEVGQEFVNPIGCQDCHDPKTMSLRITRPALIEAYERQGKDIKEFSHQEMRSLVCAQCHVEYYFKKPGNYLTFPWDKGFSADDMEAYFDEIEFSDWTHKLSRAPMLKAQHPDYELFMTGVHAERGVSCADCHMPYKMEGGVKFTDHHLSSPLRNVAASCQVCHRESEAQLVKDVTSRQDKVLELRRLAEKSLAAAHIEAKASWDAGATEAQMAPVLKLIRHAQWRWDWVAAANGVGFHSPVEALRVLGTSIQKAEQARAQNALVLVRLGVQLPIPMPDISTKALAQKYIGLDMDKLRNDKIILLETVVKEWDKQALKRQGTLIDYKLDK
ncbi:MAG: ammonia-forming cytochrome c nitrite reductase [Ignavibacteriae bacterium HGW-Ignavibacteriae-1]|jgi:nitrite reductase (cytochrome c-552)|nr:MAG: ammonia-forming cytochrome c nitrite reductase [Ignavibacteriae bacterium HGW-Ignavibacteriae-1]